MSFAWDEFFFHRVGDPSLAGLTVHFNYTHKGDDLQVSRFRTRKGRWAGVPDPGRSGTPRLPERPIDFVSLARIIPPAEIRPLRRRSSAGTDGQVELLSESSVEAMSSVFERSYDSVGLDKAEDVPLAHCSGTAQYTGFDMGSGENSAVAIFSALEGLPRGGLLLVEEIEHGLHPLAQERLVEVLTRRVSKEKQQIICTTHSEYIIDALPQAARLLVKRVGAGHEVVAAPTTRDLMFTMTGKPRPELTLYVEDSLAEMVVEQALVGRHRRRVKVVPIGSGEEVVGQLGTHLAAGFEGPAMCVLDGDCREAEIRRWAKRAGVDPELCLKLPQDEMSPERWLLDALMEGPFLSELARQVRLDAGEVLAILSELVDLPDPHSVPWEFATRCSVPPESAAYILASCAGTHPALEGIREAVAARLGP
jgi:hypothetical protein